MLILASNSPQRRELLGLITSNFAVIPADADETVLLGDAEEAVRELARRKASAVAAAHPNDLVIGADTLVALDGRMLGKPRDESDAKEMLEALSGKAHTVSTGVALLGPERSDLFACTAQVEFIPLEKRDIDAYVATGEPMDKAGSYGIQGYGAKFVAGVTGDYYTVVGLPVSELWRRLRLFPGYEAL